MIDKLIKSLLILLLIFTPIAFGAMEIWGYSVMEIGILLIIVLCVGQQFFLKARQDRANISLHKDPIILSILFLFLALVFFQIIPLSPGMMKVISPKTYALRHQLLMSNSPLQMIPISFVPFFTKIEFFKWLCLTGLFLFLLRWNLSGNRYRTANHLILVIMSLGVAESLYGMFEFFSGHRQIPYLNEPGFVSAVTGTFLNRNYFAGYLLMVIPLSCGFFFAREARRSLHYRSWRDRISSMDGKTMLIGFGLILMVLGLLFSTSRMGIASLLLSFSLISILFRDPEKGNRFSRTSLMILGLAILWAAWIGLDAVLSRFFSTSSDDVEARWKIWVNTFQILRDFPLFGSGLGTFSQIFPMYRSFYIRGIVTHAENDFLQLASEVGLVGAGLLFILFVFLFYRAATGILKLPSREPMRYVGISGLISILALTFHSIVERNIQVPANAFLLTFIWSLVLTISSKATDQQNGSVRHDAIT